MVTVITFADILYAVAGVTYVINHVTILIKWTRFAYEIFKALSLRMKYVDQKYFVKLYIRKSIYVMIIGKAKYSIYTFMK